MARRLLRPNAPHRTSGFEVACFHWRMVLLGSLGLVLQAVGYAAGWSGHVSFAVALWDVGMIVLVAPFGVAILRQSASDLGRLLLGLALALGLYFSWLLASPVFAAHFDEMLHVSNLVVLARHGFFQHHDKLVVGPFFPGLELATLAVHWCTGLPLIVCQITVAVLGRTIFVMALFGLTRIVTGSGRAAGLAVVLYAGSQHFYYYNAQYHYQLQALALFTAGLYLLCRSYPPGQDRVVRFCRALAVVAALTVTHHLTSWIFGLGLMLVTVLFAIGREWERAKLTGLLASISALFSLSWAYVVGPRLIEYLQPVLGTAGLKMMQVLEGQTQGRVIGESASGDKAPIWELVAMAGSVLLWLVVLTPSCWNVWLRGSLGHKPVRYSVLVLASVYPFLFLARFNAQSGEVADRMSTFAFIAMVIVISVSLLPRLPKLKYVVPPALVIMVIGGAILGAGPGWRRVPGPYLPAADQRSVTSESLAVAEWVERYVPPGSVIGTDSTMEALLPTIADVRLNTPQAGTPGLVALFYAARVQPQHLSQLASSGTDFLIVDTRLADKRATLMDRFEDDYGYGVGPENVLPVSALRKFDHTPGFTKVMDDGVVKIYDVRSITGKPRTFVDNPPEGLPGDHSVFQMIWTLALGVVLVLFSWRCWRLRPDPRLDNAMLVIPVMIVIGALAVAVHGEPVVGSAVLTLATALAVRRMRRQPERSTTISPYLWRAVAVALVMATATGISVRAEFEHLLPRHSLPAPQEPGRTFVAGTD